MVACKRALELIQLLNLIPHPEGGFYREIFRSEHRVIQENIREERSAITTIYFLLISGNCSIFHRIGVDEIWHFYEGSPLELIWLESNRSKQQILDHVSDVINQVAVVPGGCWQTARTLGEYTLVGCTVGPGFEYKDFELLSSNIEEERKIKKHFPDLWRQIEGWSCNTP